MLRHRIFDFDWQIVFVFISLVNDPVSVPLANIDLKLDLFKWDSLGIGLIRHSNVD